MVEPNAELLNSSVFIQSGLVATLDGKFLDIDTSKYYTDGRETGQLIVIVEVTLN